MRHPGEQRRTGTRGDKIMEKGHKESVLE